MQYRVGTCGSCNATFKVPATFPADKAKCKSCADGVVEIGPPVDEPEPEPETFEEHVPSGKSKDSGPSMMEKLRAKRAAEAAAAAPRPVPSRKPAAPKRAAPEKASDSGGDGADSSSPKKRAGARTGPRTRAAARRTAGKSSRKPSDSRRSGGRSRRDQKDGDDAENSGRRQPKKKSPLPLVGSLLFLLIAAFLVWKFVLSDAPVAATTTDDTVAEAGSQTDPEGTADVTEEPTTPEPEELVEEVPAEDPPAEEPEEAAEPVNRYDPSSVDLAALEVFEAQEGTTPAEWSDIQQLTATAIDPDAGAAGTRAVKKLIETYGSKAFGSIVNRMAKLDYSTEQGYRDGDVLQRALMDISNGKNAGWEYGTGDREHYLNKKAVMLLHRVWARARSDEAYWLKYSKQDDPLVEEVPAEDPPAEEPR
jgi:hypothetical protein